MTTTLGLEWKLLEGSFRSDVVAADCTQYYIRLYQTATRDATLDEGNRPQELSQLSDVVCNTGTETKVVPLLHVRQIL